MRGLVSFCLMLCALVASSGAALAQCGQPQRVDAGDTLLSLATEAYGDAEQWALIYYANQDALDASGFRLAPGMTLVIPCAPGQEPVAAEATPLQQVDAELTLVTGSNFAPFTDLDWPGQGMFTELVNAVLEMSPSPVPYAIAWENDWAQHLTPILDGKQADMGFPWAKPDCEKTPENYRCSQFHFSDPLVDVLIMLFVRADGDMRFDQDSDIFGKRICRPTGFFTHDLDRKGREWLSQGKITLLRAESPHACFEMVQRGEADAASVNVFTGAKVIEELGLRGEIVPLERPVSSEGLHVIISKSHWRGTTHLFRINAGLRALRASARYDEIVARHLGIFWDQIRTN
ncbi:ABC transporter substrate-binding protein [Primorskyibacter sp. S187A]|uniref:ABC transporter substrate-binding protein n=1 Tax=Primorskyibacter sp. S187A TaxID=3415130 RepID=UPI003C7A333C